MVRSQDDVKQSGPYEVIQFIATTTREIYRSGPRQEVYALVQVGNRIEKYEIALCEVVE